MLRRICFPGCLLLCGILIPTIAGGQVVTCTASPASSPTLRWEGISELTADLILDCTGSTTAQFVNLQVYLNTYVTSRVFGPDQSEALLVIDDPTNPVLGQSGRAGGNVFAAKQSGNNYLHWDNIPFTSPPVGGRRRLRFKNIRVNATGIAMGPSGMPGQVRALVVASGSASVPIVNSAQTVGLVSPGLEFSVKDGRNPIDPLAGGVVVTPRLSAPTEPAAYLRFTEGFESAFRHRGENDANPAGTSSPDYGTESGFKLGLVVGGDATAGRADFGTRVVAGFANIPRGVHVWVGLHDLNGRTRLTAGETAAYQPVPSTAVFGNTHVAEVSLAGGAGTAVWEVLINPAGIVTYDFPVFFTTDSVVGDGTGTVTGRLGPASTVITGDRDSPIPRFARGIAWPTAPLVIARNVQPVNPLVVSCNPVAGPTTTGTPYSIACTASGGQGPYQWSISNGTLPAGLSLSSAGAAATISGTPTAAGAYQFSVTAQDSSVPANRADQSYSGMIGQPAPSSISVTCSPTAGPATAGIPYLTTCTASGGQTPYHWSVGEGTLPAGLILTASWGGMTATVSGTPTTNGAYRFTVTVQDSAVPPNRGGQPFSGTIGPPAPSISVACVPDKGPSAVGTAYSTACTAQGGVAPYNWSIREGRLPDGLALSATTGGTVAISGTPTTAGNYSFVAGVTDSSSPAQSASWPFSGTLAFPFKTFNAAGFLEGTISADSIASLYGSGLALRTESCGGSVVTTLGGASVKVIDSAGVGREAQLFFASDGQINFLIPRETATGAAAIRLTKAGASGWLTGAPVTVADVAPGIFVVSGGSKVPAAFYLRVTQAGQRFQEYTFDPVTLAAADIPREAGDAIYLLLYGTGFRRCGGRVTATANGQTVPVLGAVAQIEFAGLDQVNIGPLPANLASGVVTVRLEFDGKPANEITVRLR